MSQTKAQLIDPVDGTIVNADISASAAIAGTKISPDFGSQAISTTGGLSSGTLNITGTTARINLTDSNNNSDYQVANENGLFRIRDTTNSVDRLDVDSSGNVGIGTSSPSDLLHLKSTSVDVNLQIEATGSGKDARIKLLANSSGLSQVRMGDQDDGDRGALTYDHSDDSLQFRVNDSEKARIISSGNVGIGITSPSSKLQVRDSSQGCIVRVTAANDSDAGIDFGDDDDTDIGRIRYSNSTNSMKFIVNASERMRIDSAGKVGIGTSPDAGTKLHIHQTDATAGNNLKIENNYSSSGTTNLLIASRQGDAVSANLQYIDSDTRMNFGTSTGHDLSIMTNGTEQVRVKSDGKVGIGTTTPSTRFEVRDSSATGISSRSTSTQATDSNKGLRVRNNSDTDTFSVSYKGQGYFAGSVGIGTTSPTRALHVIANANDDAATFLNQDTTNGFGINVQGGGTATDKYILRLAAGDGSEKARVTNQGTLLLGTNSRDESGQKITAVHSDSMIHLTKTGTGNKSCIVFLHGRATGNTKGNACIFRAADGASVGTIRVTASGTEFNVTSDYRLKENVVPISDGITRLKALKPSRFNFIKDPTKTFDGFLAHEVAPAVPEAISGEKDAVITQALIDSGDAPDGEIDDPIYQEIDQSKLVPLLTAALQEAIAKIETLETKNETLETKVAALEAA